jgi:AcrR family transcriptional regulator
MSMSWEEPLTVPLTFAEPAASTKTAAYSRLRPGPGQPRSEVATSQRSRIQRAMTELVATGGYRSVTVRNLTRLARVSTGAFYSQFDGADECLLMTYRNLMETVQDRVSSARSPVLPLAEQGRQSLSALTEALLASPADARLALFEVFAAGPAGVASVKDHETRLESTLRETFSRRGRRISSPTVAWITAGTLHLLRSSLASSSLDRTAGLSRLRPWGEACLVAEVIHLRGDHPPDASSARGGSAEMNRHLDKGGGDTDLILSAVMRLARDKGYESLTLEMSSKAAGIPAARFRRCFPSLEEAYLLGIERTVRRLFAGIGRLGVGGGDWRRDLCEEVAALSCSIAAEPGVARLALSGVLAPGLPGLTRRERLIDELAATWRIAIPPEERPAIEEASASIASLWNALTRAVEGDEVEMLPRETGTNAYLMLLPILGPESALGTVVEALGSEGLTQVSNKIGPVIGTR